MVSDLDKLKSLFDEWKIPYEEDDGEITVTAGWKDDPRLVGYMGFCTVFSFDENDKFVRMGIWE